MRSCIAGRGECVAEMLEGRRMLSVNVTQTGDVLEIAGDGAANVVRVFDSHTSMVRRMVVHVDANGNGSFTDPGDLNGAIYENVQRLVARLGLGSDTLEITTADPLDGASRSYEATLGSGNDVFRFTNPVGNDLRNSSVDLTVNSGGGADQVSLSLNRFVNTRFAASLLTSYGDDSVSIYGGNDVADSDVSVNAQLGDGNDSLLTRLDWDGFDLIGALSRWSVSALGGAGNDALRTEGFFGNNGADVYGTLAFNYQGESGWDQIDFGLDRFTLRGGTLSVRGNGGINGDVLSLSADIGTVGGGLVDVALRGNNGMDQLSVNATAQAGLSYAAAGGAILDGGTGFDTAVVQGTLPVVLLNIEA